MDAGRRGGRGVGWGLKRATISNELWDKGFWIRKKRCEKLANNP